MLTYKVMSILERGHIVGAWYCAGMKVDGSVHSNGNRSAEQQLYDKIL